MDPEPRHQGVSLGELNWSIVNVTKENEVQVLSEFQRKGGKVLNALYMPPEEGDFCSYQQKEGTGSAVAQWVGNVVSSLQEWVFPSPKPERVPVMKTLSCVAWSSDGVFIALSFPDGSVHVYDTFTQRWNDSSLRLELPLSVHSISWKPDSHHTLAVASERGVLVWDFRSSSEYQLITSLSCALQAEYSPNGEFLAVIRRNDCSVYCYSTLDYALSFTLGSFSALPVELSFSRDSCLLAVRMNDGSVVVYNMLSLRHEVWTMPSHTPILDYGFSGDSQALFVLCHVGTQVVLYTLQLSHQLNCLYGSMTDDVCVLNQFTHHRQPAFYDEYNQHNQHNPHNQDDDDCMICLDAKGGRLACGWREQNRVDVYRVEGRKLLLIGSLRSGVEMNGVVEMSFGKREAGSVLCVVWRSGHVLFYHLCYCRVCNNRSD